jgi:hypothetical protein
MRFILISFLLISFFQCKKSVDKAIYNGHWVAKDLINNDKIDLEILQNKNVYLPIVAFGQTKGDSMKFYFSTANIKTLWAFKAFDTYNLTFNLDKETLFAYDYNTKEVLFRDRHYKRYYRFVRLDAVKNPKLKTELMSYFKVKL